MKDLKGSYDIFARGEAGFFFKVLQFPFRKKTERDRIHSKLGGTTTSPAVETRPATTTALAVWYT